jgi:methyl-accepting chemotaxis protein
MAASIKFKTYASLACLLVGNLATIGILSYTNTQTAVLFDSVARQTNDLEAHITPFGTLVKQIELDVVQVQQFLSDYSATRGQDGLDDGIKEAREYAEKLERDLASARTHADALGRPDLLLRLREVEEAFPAYFDMGQIMAHAYAEKGTGAGNALMPKFDEQSDALQEKVKKLLASREAMISAASAGVRNAIGALQKANARADLFVMSSTVLLTLLALVCGAALVLGVVRPIVALARLMENLAGDRGASDIPFVSRRDEIGQMARATNVFKEAIEARENLRRDQEAAAERMRSERRRERMELADHFAERVAAVVDGLGRSADRIGSNARGLESIAGAVAGRSEETTRAMLRADQNIQIVATAAAHLSTAIAEVEETMRRAGQVSKAATDQARRTNDIVVELSQATQRIGEIVGLINSVAAQTNLLALNATIEAARAGEAGRGFAVVAQEVKALAAQTSQATEDIAGQIDAVQSVTGTAVSEVNGITEAVAEIGAILDGVSQALDEQTSSTHEIARSIEATTRETGGMAENVRAVDEDARQSSTAAVAMVAASDELVAIAGQIRRETSAFVERMRA